MADQPWAAVDEYICDLLLGSDPDLEAALESSREAGLPPIAVAPNQGKLLHLLIRSLGASSVLEIGTLGGYSAIWMARALPAGGRLVTLEAAPKHAEVARSNLDRAGVGDRVEIRLAPALDSLEELAADGGRPLRLRLHRRRQGEHPRLLRVVAQPVAGRTRSSSSTTWCATGG